MNSVLFSQTMSSAQAYPVWWPDLDHHHEKGPVTVKHNAHSCDLTSGMWGVCSETKAVYVSRVRHGRHCPQTMRGGVLPFVVQTNKLLIVFLHVQFCLNISSQSHL